MFKVFSNGMGEICGGECTYKRSELSTAIHDFRGWDSKAELMASVNRWAATARAGECMKTRSSVIVCVKTVRVPASRRLRRFAVALALCFLWPGVAAAAPIRFAGPTVPEEAVGASLIYRATPQSAPQAVFMPTDLDVVLDLETGAVDIAYWTVYDADLSEVLYSLGPQSLVLPSRPTGGYEGLGADGETVILKEGIPGGFGFALFVHPNPAVVIERPLLPQFPGIQRFDLQALVVRTPEPSAVALVLPACLLARRRRGRN